MAILSFLARPFTQLTPAFARDVLDVGAAGLGALNSAAGAGALAGAVLAAMLGSYRGRGLALMLSAAGFGLLLVAFGLSTSFTLSLVLCGGIGLLSAFSGINTNTMMQTHADARMRGRVISLHGLTMMGVVPLGVMLEGALGSLIGVPMVVVVAGAAAVLVMILHDRGGAEGPRDGVVRTSPRPPSGAKARPSPRRRGLGVRSLLPPGSKLPPRNSTRS